MLPTTKMLSPKTVRSSTGNDSSTGTEQLSDVDELIGTSKPVKFANVWHLSASQVKVDGPEGTVNSVSWLAVSRHSLRLKLDSARNYRATQEFETPSRLRINVPACRVVLLEADREIASVREVRVYLERRRARRVLVLVGRVVHALDPLIRRFVVRDGPLRVAVCIVEAAAARAPHLQPDRIEAVGIVTAH